MKILGSYKNNDYTCTMFSDGTKIRWNDKDSFNPIKPESIDLKISNRCDMACGMCFVAGTKILMGDLTYKNIEDIQVGDVVIGFEEKASKRGAKRKMFKTKVLNTFVHVESELVSVTTDTNNTITSTPNHPFLSEGTGKNHSRIFNKIGNMSIGHNLFECGFPIDYVDYDSEQYKLGYAVGSWAGDGCFQHYTDKNGYDAYICRFVTKDEEINDMVYECTKCFAPDIYRLDFTMSGNNGVKSSVRSNKREVYNTIVNLERESLGNNTSKEYYCGFLAGFFDSEGHIDNQRSIVRLSNTDMKYIDEILRCLNGINIDSVVEEVHRTNTKHKDCFNVRIKGQYAVSRFLWYTRPVCKRKSLDNYISNNFQYYKHQIASIEQVDKKQYVYNFETECHTYIANNLLVHNCHENSTPDGKHGDILNLPFIETMFPYSEIAIGGGNPLTHPDLIEFLEGLKERKIIASMTVNQVHFMHNIDLLKELTDKKLIYGLGISYIGGRHENCINAIKQFPNAVVHVINGIVHMDELEALANNDLKILVLGYKEFRRGKTLYDECGSQINYLKAQFYDMLPKMVNDGWFKCISFDNLAIKQLEPKRLMSEKDYKEFYMGDDGSFSLYVDSVNRQFAKSSVSTERYDLMDDIADMFKVIKDGINGK